VFLNFVLISVTLILCLICLNLTFESLFMNYVFECLIYFVTAIIAWPGDKPIFQKEEDEMRLKTWPTPLIITLEEIELLNYDRQGDLAPYP